MTTKTESVALVCEPESVADVLEEMQGLAEAAEAREFDISLEDLRDYAQRIQAAHAREVGELQDQLRQLKCDTLNFISLFTSGNSIFIDIHHVAKLHGRDIARDATALRDKINGTSGAITREIIT